MFNLEF